MEKTLQILNQLEKEGQLGRYAIGGAMGATFYVEPVLTYDLDIFVILPHTSSGLISLTALYDILKNKGYKFDAECVVIEGVPVQFLPAYNDLLEEALKDAVDTIYEKTSTRVLKVEHLLAICLQTGRDKDKQRVKIFLEQAKLDYTLLEQIIKRYHLEEKWNLWKK